jgi:hypothetical protein
MLASWSAAARPWRGLRPTGIRTKFGRPAELVRTAHVVSSQQKAVPRVVRNLAVFNGILIVALVAYTLAHLMPWKEIIPPGANGGSGKLRLDYPAQSDASTNF